MNTDPETFELVPDDNVPDNRPGDVHKIARLVSEFYLKLMVSDTDTELSDVLAASRFVTDMIWSFDHLTEQTLAKAKAKIGLLEKSVS